jgi:hypothetical protein
MVFYLLSCLPTFHRKATLLEAFDDYPALGKQFWNNFKVAVDGDNEICVLNDSLKQVVQDTDPSNKTLEELISEIEDQFVPVHSAENVDKMQVLREEDGELEAKILGRQDVLLNALCERVHAKWLVLVATDVIVEPSPSDEGIMKVLQESLLNNWEAVGKGLSQDAGRALKLLSALAGGGGLVDATRKLQFYHDWALEKWTDCEYPRKVKLLDVAVHTLEIPTGPSRIIGKAQEFFSNLASQALSAPMHALAPCITTCRDLVDQWDTSDGGKKMTETLEKYEEQWQSASKICDELEAVYVSKLSSVFGFAHASI